MYLQGVENVYDLRVDATTRVDLPRRVPPERGRAVDVQLRALRTRQWLFEHFGDYESEAKRLMEAKLRAARLRDGAEGRAHVQPARCARRDLGDRARGVHRPHPHPRAQRRAGLLRVARSARLSRCCRAALRRRRPHEAPAMRERPATHRHAAGRAAHRGAAAQGAGAARRRLRRRACATELAQRGFLAGERDVDRLRHAAPPRGRRSPTCARIAARYAGRAQKLLPVERRPRRATASPTRRRSPRSCGAGGAGGIGPALRRLERCARPTARPTRSVLDSAAKGHRRSQPALQAALAEAIAKLPIPKVMSYAAPGRQTTCSSCGRRTASSRCTAARSSPVTALGLDGGPHDARPPLPGRAADRRSPAPTTTRARSRAEGKVVAVASRRAARAIVAALEARGRRATRRSMPTTRCSTR